MAQERTTVQHLKKVFKSENLQLEGILSLPEGKKPFPAVIVCHPHSQMGGSMHNSVVDSICEALLARKLVAFKFNFRGVGGSQGGFGNGQGEQADAHSAIEYIAGLMEIDKKRLGLAGYSAGAAWGIGGTCCEDAVKAVVAVSPPLSIFDFSFLKECAKPKLVITGDQDRFVEIQAYQRFCFQLVSPIESMVIQGADHFWSGYEITMANKVADFFASCL